MSYTVQLYTVHVFTVQSYNIRSKQLSIASFLCNRGSPSPPLASGFELNLAHFHFVHERQQAGNMDEKLFSIKLSYLNVSCRYLLSMDVFFP